MVESTIEELIKSCNPKNSNEAKEILREILQKIVLIGLSKKDFFKYASFYGGTALRLFYDLNRFSEDLDFTLNKKNNDFSLIIYKDSIKEVANSYGLDIDIDIKDKIVSTNIESAFAKLNTYQTFINFKINRNILNLIHKDELIKVKFEVDKDPSLGFNYELKWIDVPEYASVSVLDLPSLLSGKIHAILCRTYKNNVKGRDYYDFLFYMRKRVKPNMKYLMNKLIESKVIKEDDDFDINILKEMLIKKFENVDFNMIKEDIKKFLVNNENVDFYSKELFIDVVKRL